METTTIFREGEYELVKHKYGLAPYAIFRNNKQISMWYCSMGWADRKLKQLRRIK